LRALTAEVIRDAGIWQHKSYLGRPALTSGDGPIIRYRTWTRQFYREEQQ
jgi:hypothetical protein